MQCTHFPLGARRLIAIVAMLLGLLAMAPTASANHEEFGVCHATGSPSNPFVFISPDQGSGHLNTDESPAGPAHADDRPATEAEFEAGACDGQTEFPTEEPTDPAATEEPTDPAATEEPTDPAATEEPISEVPNTGSFPTDASGGPASTMLAGSLLVALLFLGSASWLMMRARKPTA